VNQKHNALRLQGRSEPYLFDYVADQKVTQEEIFERVGRPLVDNCLRGYNGTAFAYGQTGSGKTHTMLGRYPNRPDSEPGLTPRVFRYLFDRISSDIFDASVGCVCVCVCVYTCK
jgi:Kinesin motor domain